MSKMHMHDDAVLSVQIATSGRGCVYSAEEISALAATIRRTPLGAELSPEHTAMLRRLDLVLERTAAHVILRTGSGAVVATVTRATATGRAAARARRKQGAPRSKNAPRVNGASIL